MRAFITRGLSAFRKMGPKNFLKKLVLRIIYNSIALPIAIALFLLSPVIKIKFIKLCSGRIGHFGLNTHLMLCALNSVEYKEEQRYKHFFYADPIYPICNIQLYKMWQRAIPILPWRNICFHIDSWLIILSGKRYNSEFKSIFETSPGGYDIWNFFGRNKKCYLSFHEEEKTQAQHLMQELGLPPQAKYVCLLVRDKKYLQSVFPENDDWIYHSYRDANIYNFEPAIQFLVDNGYYVIRMGRHAENPLRINHPQVIDYAFHKSQCDLLDIYLSAHCYFFITTSTGIDSIPQIFQRPVLAVNANILDIKRSDHQNWNLCIPRKVINLKDNKLLKFSEIVNEAKPFIDTPACPGLHRPSMFSAWRQKKLQLQENTPEEILEAVDEMLSLLKNGLNETDEEYSIQKHFWRTTSSVDHLIRARVSTHFLKRHWELLGINEPLEMNQ